MFRWEPLVRQRLLGTGMERGCPGFESEPSWISQVNRSVYRKLETPSQGERPGSENDSVQEGWVGKNRQSYPGLPQCLAHIRTKYLPGMIFNAVDKHINSHAHHVISTNIPTVCRILETAPATQGRSPPVDSTAAEVLLLAQIQWTSE